MRNGLIKINIQLIKTYGSTLEKNIYGSLKGLKETGLNTLRDMCDNIVIWLK